MELQSDLLQQKNNIIQSMDQRLQRLEKQFEHQPQWQHPPAEPQSAVLVLLPPELPTASVPSNGVAKMSTRRQGNVLHYKKENPLDKVAMINVRVQTSEPKEERKRGQKEEADENKRKGEAKKRKEEEEAEKKKKEDEGKKKRKEKRKEVEEANKKRKEEEEEHKRKQVEEEQKKKREEEEQKREAEEAEKRRKEVEEEQKRKREEKEEEKKRKEQEEEKRKTEVEEPEDYRYYKAPKVNVSTSEPIFVSSQESTDTLPTSKKEGRRDYAAQEVDILRTNMKCRDIDSTNWSLRYPDPCPQQRSGDNCVIFTCKYIECLARRDTQGFPFSPDDKPTVRARFTLHFIKAYFNAQERSERI
ncbi:hypothetical protein Taro_029908 [Colocasia esculenta]|uniref:Ubiquitin-like protease family profile domain-containing protein n=1 Tax=Colocasia esculenta TaxID=4460 RepID=A0A843VSJ0_COLES|nr:hypothetical protein [Colocasia esculenta]